MGLRPVERWVQLLWKDGRAEKVECARAYRDGFELVIVSRRAWPRWERRISLDEQLVEYTLWEFRR